MSNARSRVVYAVGNTLVSTVPWHAVSDVSVKEADEGGELATASVKPIVPPSTTTAPHGGASIGSSVSKSSQKSGVGDCVEHHVTTAASAGASCAASCPASCPASGRGWASTVPPSAAR